MESDEIDVPDVTAAEQLVPPPAIPVAHAGTDRLVDLRSYMCAEGGHWATESH